MKGLIDNGIVWFDETPTGMCTIVSDDIDRIIKS